MWRFTGLLRYGLKRYHVLADVVGEMLKIINLVVFSVSVTAVACVLLFLEQSQEALRVASEAWSAGAGPVMLIFSSALFFAAASWYCARVLIYQLSPQLQLDTSWRGGAARQIPRLTGCAIWFALGLALWKAQIPKDGPQEGNSRLVWLMIWSLVSGVLFFAFTALRGRWLRAQRTELLHDKVWLSFRDLDRATRTTLLCAHAMWATMFIATIASEGQFASALGPLPVVFLGLASWIPFGSGLHYFSRIHRFPFIAVLIGAALLFSWLDWNDNHPIRALDSKRTGLPPEFTSSFDDWLKSRADLAAYGGDAYPVFLVSAEGGGLRTAYNTAMILSAIQDRCPAFAQHVFAISGVSGGSVGACVFAGLCAEYAANSPSHPYDLPISGRGTFQDKAHQILSRDLLSPLLAKALYPDLLQQFLPFPVDKFDRAVALEVGLERAWREATSTDRFSESFYSPAAAKPNQVAPLLMLNTTLVETGERFIISNFYPIDERFTRLWCLADMDWKLDIRLSTAAGASARFPIVTPAAYGWWGGRPGNTKVRLADGGYFENSGALGVRQLIAALRLDYKWPGRPNFRLIVLRIGSPFKAVLSSNGTVDYPHGFGEVLSPLRAMLNTRDARGALAVKELDTAITTELDNGRDAALIPFDLIEENVKLPTGWLLSDAAREDMRRQLGSPKHGDAPGSINPDSAYSFGEVIEALRPPPTQNPSHSSTGEPDAK